MNHEILPLRRRGCSREKSHAFQRVGAAVTFPDDAAVIAPAKPLNKQFEGFAHSPYLCPAGKWTVGLP